jgi:hypothetical protein
MSSTPTVNDGSIPQQLLKVPGVKSTGNGAKAKLLGSTTPALGIVQIEETAVVPSRKPRKKYKSARRHRFDDGGRAAAWRAYSGARLVLLEGLPVAVAARRTGSNAGYVRCLLTVLRSEDGNVLADVLAGDLPIDVAAKLMKSVADLVMAMNRASTKTIAEALVTQTTANEQAEIARHLPKDWAWDHLVLPGLDPSEAEQSQQGI